MARVHQRPRISIEITEEQRKKLHKYLAYGEQRRVLSIILNDVISMLDKYGHGFVTYMLERGFSYSSVMEKFDANRRSSDTTTDEDDSAGAIEFNNDGSC